MVAFIDSMVLTLPFRHKNLPFRLEKLKSIKFQGEVNIYNFVAALVAEIKDKKQIK